MSSELNYQVWLPKTALNDGHLLAWLAKCIQGWGVAWMGSERAKNLLITENFSNFSQFKSSHFLSGGPALAIQAPDRKALAEHLLGKSFDGVSANTKDRSVVSGLLEDALADALLHLSDDSERAQKGSIEENWVSQFSVTYNDPPLFLVALPSAFAIEQRKNLAPEIMENTIEFGDIRTAINTKVVQLEAEVGYFSFNIGEVSNLKVGDVIELDKSVDEGFPLKANGNRCEGIQARFIITQLKKRARRQPNIILEHSNE